jgi:thymidylate synthase (FAD)
MSVIHVSRMNSMGSDLTVVNAARVSFAKHKDEVDDDDERLIKYLAQHGHWSPFSHVFIQFKIDAPIFVARQLQKHQVGLTWNEISRRYVDSEPEMYQVYEWRRRSANKKQGSMSEPIPSQEIANTIKKELDDKAVDVYNRLLKLKVCPEQARMVLPQDMMTSWYWSGSLYAFSRVCNLRLKEDAQYETRQVAQRISDYCAVEFPVSWKYLCQADGPALKCPNPDCLDGYLQEFSAEGLRVKGNPCPTCHGEKP